MSEWEHTDYSPMNMIDGCFSRAMSNNARTSFSLSPMYLRNSGDGGRLAAHFDVREDADMEKNVAVASAATALSAHLQSPSDRWRLPIYTHLGDHCLAVAGRPEQKLADDSGGMWLTTRGPYQSSWR